MEKNFNSRDDAYMFGKKKSGVRHDYEKYEKEKRKQNRKSISVKTIAKVVVVLTLMAGSYYAGYKTPHSVAPTVQQQTDTPLASENTSITLDAPDQSTTSGSNEKVLQTSKNFDNVKIFENKYFAVTLTCIKLHEVDLMVQNKTDVDFTIMVSDLIMDGTRYGESDSCYEILSGETSELVYHTEEKTLDIHAVTMSGAFQFIDDGDLYGGVQKEIPFEEVSLE